MYRITIIVLSIIVFFLPIAQTQAASEWSPLMRAAFYGDLNRVKDLLSAGAHVNVKDGEGSTPLMVAASQGHSAIVRELLSRGAEINAQNNYGWTPLMLAITARHKGIVELLLARGANSNIKNRDGKTALMIAESVGLAHLFSSTARTPDRQEAPGVTQLLAQAEQQLKGLRLTQPLGNNAYESYRKVLELDPNNAKAKAGLEQIATEYERLAQQHLREGALQESLAHIESGLQVLPSHPGLRALQRDVRLQLAAQERQDAEPGRQQRAEETPQSRRQDEIRRLLAQAKRQLDTMRLTLPAGDNAYESYQKILELDPNNAEAKAGLERIAAQYEQWAQRYKKEETLEKSLSYIERGLLVQPQHAGLIALQKEVQAQLAEPKPQRAEQEGQQREIERLLAQAKRQLDTMQLTQPAGDNAYESYRKVLELEPDHAQAQAGLAQIATGYEQLAQQHQAEGAFQESLAAIETGLQVQPAHKGLLTLQDEVQAQLAEQERQREVVGLLAQAEQQLKAQQLIQPEGDNAYESYRKVLELEPGHTQAQAGLAQIAATYEQRAQQHQAEGAFQESLATIEAGLQVQPQHKGLVALQDEVQAQLAEQERQRREIAQLLTQAEQQVKAQRLTQPAGDNAYESYQQVLTLDPDNAKAQAGLEELLTQAQQLLREKTSALRQIEQELDAEEQAMRLSIQRALAEEWKQRMNDAQ